MVEHKDITLLQQLEFHSTPGQHGKTFLLYIIIQFEGEKQKPQDHAEVQETPTFIGTRNYLYNLNFSCFTWRDLRTEKKAFWNLIERYTNRSIKREYRSIKDQKHLIPH